MLRCRKLNRLAGYDYSSPGAYFIPICTKNREICFGGIKNGVMVFNKYGEIVNNRWLWLFNQYHYLKIDEFCVMPDHFHGINRRI